MSVYTVQAPLGPSGAIELEKAVFLREGFSFGAFCFGFFWLLAQRLWLVALAWLALAGLFGWLAFTHLSFGSTVLVGLAFRLLLGLEAHALLRDRLQRRGYQLVGVVAARNHERAERQFFFRAMGSQAPAPPPAEASSAPMPAHHSGVLGLFPEPETPR